QVLWVAVLPAIAAVAVLVLYVKEPARRAAGERAPRIAFASLGSLGRRYWTIVALGAVLTLARFSEAFLVLRAHELGLALALVPLVLVLMNLVYTAVAYPAGVAADRGHRRALLLCGIAALIAADLVIAAWPSVAALAVGIVLWGAHMGLTQGLLSALVADAAPVQLRGTAFGVFHLVSGAALLVASVLAGWLWSALGASATFYAGAAFCALALAGLAIAARQG
ncbi:MAG: MFS transporter, partial [Betaproteobacteria bacterium]|nr:MFS transporter [Betaproteobacteria bacterium]